MTRAQGRRDGPDVVTSDALLSLRAAISSVRPAFAVAVLTLAACTHTAVPDLPHDVPDAWRGADAAADASAPALDAWWKAFDDAQLERLIAAARSGNLNL